MYLSDSTVLLSLFYTYYVLYNCTPYMATAITANAATAVSPLSIYIYVQPYFIIVLCL